MVFVGFRSTSNGAGISHYYFNKFHVKTNKNRLRNNWNIETSDDKRIKYLFIGDSFTFGHGVKEGENYQSIFADLLIPDKKYLNYNLGVNGANTIGEIQYLKKFLKQHSVKDGVIFYQYFGNDIDYLPKKNIASLAKLNKFEKYIRQLAQHSFLIDYIFQPYLLAKFASGYMELLEDLYAKKFTIHAKDIKKIFSVSHANNNNIVFIVFPYLNNPEIIKKSEEIYMNNTYKAFLDFCNAGDYYLGINSSFLEKIKIKNIVVNELDTHPSAELHAKIGQILSNLIKGDSTYFKACE